MSDQPCRPGRCCLHSPEQLTLVNVPALPAPPPTPRLHAKRCSYGVTHDGPIGISCFSRVQLGRAVEGILGTRLVDRAEVEQLGPGCYRFGWPVADLAAHSCSCGDWKTCWHLAAALLLELGLAVPAAERQSA